jgi:hypothetical protein
MATPASAGLLCYLLFGSRSDPAPVPSIPEGPGSAPLRALRLRHTTSRPLPPWGEDAPRPLRQLVNVLPQDEPNAFVPHEDASSSRSTPATRTPSGVASHEARRAYWLAPHPVKDTGALPRLNPRPVPLLPSPGFPREDGVVSEPVCENPIILPPAIMLCQVVRPGSDLILDPRCRSWVPKARGI